MSFGSEGSLSADALSQLGSSPFLPGGVWFMLARYGASGTPSRARIRSGCRTRPWVSSAVSRSRCSGLPKSGARPFYRRAATGGAAQ